MSQEELDDAAVSVEGGRVHGGEAVAVLLVDDVLAVGAVQQALTRLVVAVPGVEETHHTDVTMMTMMISKYYISVHSFPSHYCIHHFHLLNTVWYIIMFICNDLNCLLVIQY